MATQAKRGPHSVNQILLITISGEDQAGVTAGLTAILAEHAASILDIGQAVIHATLSLGLLDSALHFPLPEPQSSRGNHAEELYSRVNLYKNIANPVGRLLSGLPGRNRTQLNF